ncbi:MAG: type II CAAX endopeptidase family protein [Leptolyngbyaceae bacterium]|nr:type II CAAX endopeptidase family protein [Leptolyngbyaceae bacterium]
MTFRQIVLSILTALVLLVSAGPALVGSLEQQQISDRLELYQTDMMLQASELKVAAGDEQLVPVQSILIGQSPLESGLKAYQSTRQTAAKNLQRLQTQLAQLRANIGVVADDALAGGSAMQQLQMLQTQFSQVQGNLVTQQALLNQLDLQIGVLQAAQGDVSTAQQTWMTLLNPVTREQQASEQQEAIALLNQADPAKATAAVLQGLWAEPGVIAPDAAAKINQQLTGWFRDRTLRRLYELQGDTVALTALQQARQTAAQQVTTKLALIGVGPLLGCLIGGGLLIFAIVQRFVMREKAVLAEPQAKTWEVAWNWEITWQVIVVGFFFVGQLVIPILFQLFKPQLAQVGSSVGLVAGRFTAVSTLIVYGLMAAGAIGVLYASIKEYGPLANGWFRIKFQEFWWLWGLGGYLVAVPLVIGVSIANQTLWQGRGGSNPLLQTVLEEGDGVALGVFFFTAAIAAPLFEELFFRGFLLPSLTRYTSTWGAIALSSLLFATAHLSVSEILPLTVLGIVLGFVYSRTNNLLAPMMVHSLWNSATMLGLLVLGSSV